MSNRLRSRKFWVSIITIICGVLGLFGVADGTIETVSSILLILVPGIVYVMTEGKVDAAAVAGQIDVDALMEKLKELLVEKPRIETTD